MRKGSFFDGFLREKGVDIIAGGGGGGGVAPVILVQSEYGHTTRRVSTLFTTPEHKAPKHRDRTELKMVAESGMNRDNLVIVS